jgi:UDPglucose 6-dehydrogenase/GDP-mannose 6-dehydrogenase
VKAYDPVANHEAKQALDGVPVEYCDELGDALTGVDAVLLITRWEQFRRLPELIGRMTAPPLVVDGRRMLNKRELSSYAGIGL